MTSKPITATEVTESRERFFKELEQSPEYKRAQASMDAAITELVAPAIKVIERVMIHGH